MKAWISDEFEGNAWIAMWMKPDVGNTFRWLFVEPHDAGTVEVAYHPALRPWVDKARIQKVKILLTPEEVERYILWD